MKEYRFDYIKEMVEQWRDDVPRDVQTIAGLPFYVSLPWVDFDENCKLRVIPPHDYYGEEIEDMQDWLNQRNKYCEKLAKEYENSKTIQD